MNDPEKQPQNRFRKNWCRRAWTWKGIAQHAAVVVFIVYVSAFIKTRVQQYRFIINE